MYDLNLIVPDITSAKYSQDNKFLLLKHYLYELNEVLSLALSDKTYGEIHQLQKAVEETEEKQAVSVKQLQAQSVQKFNKLREQIISTADEIEKNYRSAISESESQLMQSVTGEFVAKSDFGDYKNTVQTTLDQQAESISLNAQSVEQVQTGIAAVEAEQSKIKQDVTADALNLEEYKKTARSELSLQSDAIISQVESVYATKDDAEQMEARVESRIVQSSTDITESFNQSIEQTAESIGEVQVSMSQFVSELEVYIRRGELAEGVYGIEIGRTDSNIKARFTNDRLSFYRGTSEIAYISGNSLYITDAHVLDYLKIGNSEQGYFMFDSTENGLEVRWING
ncbi:MAG: hypothetical protein IKV44_06595 [Clostridia bacterium]|nr:hypothetical protein [Clostridia bacterium]